MRNYQNAKVNMYSKVKVFLLDPLNSAVWAGFARLVTEVSTFLGLIGDLEHFIDKQSEEIKGVTDAKNAAFKTLVDLVVAQGLLASVWAEDVDNDTLLAVFDVVESDFINSTEEGALSKIRNFREELNDNVAAMGSVDLTAADVTALDAAILAFSSKMGTTGDAQGNKKAGTQGIAEMIPSLDKSLAKVEKLLVGRYKTSNMELVNVFMNNRRIDNPAVHHTGLEVLFRDEHGQEMEGVRLSLEGTTKVDFSDINGEASIIKVRNKTYWAVMSKVGYREVRQKVKLERGHILHLEITLNVVAKTSISGIVKDASSGAALAGVAITAHVGDNPLMTDRQGKFSASNVDAGTYNLNFVLDGYVPQTVQVEVNGVPVSLVVELIGE